MACCTQYTNSTNVASCSLLGIGTVYRIASTEYLCLLRVYHEWHCNIGLRDGSCAPRCTAQLHTSSARCLNCITAIRPSLVLLALHLTSAFYPRPTRVLRPLLRHLYPQHPQHPQLAVLPTSSSQVSLRATTTAQSEGRPLSATIDSHVGCNAGRGQGSKTGATL
jgi:hypothetical protein